MVYVTHLAWPLGFWSFSWCPVKARPVARHLGHQNKGDTAPVLDEWFPYVLVMGERPIKKHKDSKVFQGVWWDHKRARAILRLGGGKNKEGKSHESVKEVSFEINLEGQEGAYFLVAQRHIVSEAVGAPVVSLVARHSCGLKDVAKEGIHGEGAKVD